MSTGVQKKKRITTRTELPPEVPDRKGWKVVCTAVLPGLLDSAGLNPILKQVEMLGILAAKQEEIRSAVLRSNEKAYLEQNQLRCVNLRIFQPDSLQKSQDPNSQPASDVPEQPIGWGVFLISNFELENDLANQSLNQTIEVFLYPEGV